MIETAPTALPPPEDRGRNERIWQRVSPSLTPYPAPHDRTDAEREPSCRAGGGERDAELLRGFLQDELADAEAYRCLAILSPTAEGRRLMRRIAAEETAHTRLLRAAYFLLTGGSYAVSVVLPPQPKLPWRDRLRERYHAEICGGAAYARAAEETAEVCRRRLFAELSADEYRHAGLLQRHLAST